MTFLNWLTGEELAHYQQLGLVGEVDEVIGLAPFDDGFAAMWQRDTDQSTLQ